MEDDGLLQSLEEVTVYAQYYRSISRKDFLARKPNQYLAAWWSMALTLPRAQNGVYYDASFETLRKTYQDSDYSGALKGWDVTKHVWVSMPHEGRNAMECLLTRKELNSLLSRKVALVFHKPNAKSDKSLNRVDLKPIQLHAWGPLVGY